MTYEQAIKHLQNLKFKFMDEYVDYDKTAEAFQHGIEALKKQIPKSVEYYDGNDICPNCSYSFGQRKIRTHIKHWVVPYCKMCGQAIDWSDEE